MSDLKKHRSIRFVPTVHGFIMVIDHTILMVGLIGIYMLSRSLSSSSPIMAIIYDSIMSGCLFFIVLLRAIGCIVDRARLRRLNVNISALTLYWKCLFYSVVDMATVNVTSVFIISLIGIGDSVIAFVINSISISILSSSSIRWHIYGMGKLFRRLGIREYNHYAYDMYLAVYGDSELTQR